MEAIELESAKYWLSWIKWFEYISMLLVAIGVAGEFLSSIIAGQFEEVLEKARQLEIARLTKEAADARLETAKIQERFTPRTLNAEQQARIVEKLKQFAGTEFKVSVFQDPEAVGFLAMVLNILKEASWIQRPAKTAVVIRTSGEPAGVSLSTGVYIHAPPSLMELGAMTGSAFLSEGLEVRLTEASLPSSTILHIEIGKKW